MKHKIKYLFIIFLFINSLFAIELEDLNLMPYPKSINLLDGKFRLDENFDLRITKNSERLKKYSNKFLMRLANRTGLF